MTLFESNDYPGGHTHTVDVTLDGISAPVDTGFLVYNDRTYPRLIALFDELGVESVPSEMSFAVRDDRAGVEWAGTDLPALFAQPTNLSRPAFWRMLADILRFNRATTSMQQAHEVFAITLGEYLDDGAFSAPFRDWYLLPMAAAIWSVPLSAVLDFPLPTFVQFCYRHGLLQIFDRPQWRTVVGGARTYVRRMVAELSDVRLSTPVRRVRRYANHVEVDTPARTGERFDQVVFACHSDQTLALLADATRQESELLRQVRYQSNRVLLHTDVRLMPRRRRAWSAWNYLAAHERDGPPRARIPERAARRYFNERDGPPRAPQYPIEPERAARRYSNERDGPPERLSTQLSRNAQREGTLMTPPTLRSVLPTGSINCSPCRSGHRCW